MSYFHLCGSVWKRIEKFGLTNLYNNAQVNLFVGMCIALAFLSLVNQVIVNAFNLLRANVPDPALNPLLDYLEEDYGHGRQQQQQQLIGGNVIQQRLPRSGRNLSGKTEFQFVVIGEQQAIVSHRDVTAS